MNEVTPTTKLLSAHRHSVRHDLCSHQLHLEVLEVFVDSGGACFLLQHSNSVLLSVCSLTKKLGAHPTIWHVSIEMWEAQSNALAHIPETPLPFGSLVLL